jgi:hypothetical protein
MDTDFLPTETYQATLIEAERFDHNLTLHFPDNRKTNFL